MITKTYVLSKAIIPKILKNCDLYQINDIKNCVITKYRNEIYHALDYYKSDIENFSEGDFVNTLTLQTIPLLLGINMLDYISFIVNLVPNISMTHDKFFDTVTLTYYDSDS